MLRRLRTGFAIVVACTLVATACSSATPSGTESPGPASANASTRAVFTAATCHRPHRPGQSSQSFTFQGKRRTYLLYVPTSYTGNASVPLVLNFHGWGSNAAQQMALANFGSLADKHGFLVVAPNGQDRRWSFGGEPGLQNDVTMVRALLKRLQGALCVDAKRVYSTGMSDGGVMTSVLACTSADKFAAFAAVSVVIYCANRAGRTVPFQSYAGSKDPVVPTAGGRVNCCGNPTLPSKASTMAKWAAHNGCKAKYSDHKISAHVLRRRWTGCKPGSDTVYFLVYGDGHTWPGGPSLGSLGHATKEISASKRMWDFFAAHKLPG